MKQFVDDIISYISTGINSSGVFVRPFIVDREYRYKKLVTPRIGILALDNNDISRYDTFDGECVSSMPIQLDIYVESMAVNSKNKTAQEVAEIVADMLTEMFDKVTVKEWNKNILNIRRSNCPPPQPLKENGSTYMGVLRFECEVNTKYETI